MLPNVITICFCILIILIAPLLIENLETLNEMELTEAEEALKNLIVTGVAFMGILYLMGRRRR